MHLPLFTSIYSTPLSAYISTSISEADWFSIRDEQTVAGYILFSGAGTGMSFRTLLETGKVFMSSTFFSSKQTLQL